MATAWHAEDEVGNCSSCVSHLAGYADCDSTQLALGESHRAQRYGTLSSAEGGIALNTGSLRRTTRTACRKDSRSGSSLAFRAASCINPRMDKRAIRKH